MEYVNHYGCMTKKNCKSRLSTTARKFSNIRSGR